jgi:hypothetical protein
VSLSPIGKRISFNQPQNNVTPTSNQINQINPINPINPINQINQINQINSNLQISTVKRV